MDPATMFHRLAMSFSEGFLSMLPFFIAAVLLAVSSTLLVGGWNFSTQAMSPQFNRLNPLPGFKRMFSMKSLVELLKTLAKFVLIGAIAIGLFRAMEKDFVGLGLMGLHAGLARAGELLSWSFLGLSLGLLVVAMLIPVVIAAAFVGRRIATRIDQRLFDRLVIVLTVVGSLYLLLAP